MTKFEKLKSVLDNNKSESITLTEYQLNTIIDGGIPNNAFASRSYFSNDPTHSIFKAWYECGYLCTKVDRINKYIVLTKTNPLQSRVISSDILHRFFKTNHRPDYSIIVSPFTYAELTRSKEINQVELVTYLQSVDCKFIDTRGTAVSFEEFNDIQNNFSSKGEKLIFRMEKTYYDFTIYVFATGLINAVDDVDSIIEYFRFETKLPIVYFDDLLNRHSLTKSFYRIIGDFENEQNTKNLLSKIKSIDLKNASRFLLTSCTAFELRFYDYAFDNFINKLKENDVIDISPKLVEEMLNVSLISEHKQYSYVTNQKYSIEIMSGSITKRILIY